MNEIYVGIDLHSNNSYFAAVDKTGKRLFHKRFSNNKGEIIKAMEEIDKYGTVKETAVESTYNWYWLSDLLESQGYEVSLANPSAMSPYSGLKSTTDKSDAYFLADQLRLNVLPKCWKCPKDERPVRELLRHRSFLVEKRTSLKNSLTLLYQRYSGERLSFTKIEKLDSSELCSFAPDSVFRMKHTMQLIKIFDKSINHFEQRALEKLKLKPEYQVLTSVPGIGTVLALTIMLETGNINRFLKSGKYTSYCRCVESQRTSNGKRKGTNNKNCGNQYLAWAYSEAAMTHKRVCPGANKYWQKKANKTCKVLAYKALAAKLTKVCYYMLKNNEAFDEKRIYP